MGRTKIFQNSGDKRFWRVGVCNYEDNEIRKEIN